MKNQEIQIQDYISNHKKANEIITDFTTNKLIIKGSTGIGGTTAVLEITDKSVIIVSPLRGMIIGKEQSRKPHQKFIYGKSKDTWDDIECLIESGENFVVNVTPEQIISVKNKNPKLFQSLTNIPVFVDEYHIYGQDDYRENLQKLGDIIHNQWKAKWIISTATPVINNYDIPAKSEYDTYLIRREQEQPKVITVKPYVSWQNDLIGKTLENKAVFITNNLKTILQIKEIFRSAKIQFLLGESLMAKIPVEMIVDVENFGNKVFNPDADIYILSTAFTTGYDLPIDADIFIFAKYNEVNVVENRNYNEIIQGYGRIRNKVLSATIFYDNNNYEGSQTEYHRLISGIDFTNKELITRVSYNYLRSHAEDINQINIYNTYNSIELLKENLESSGFIIIDEYSEINRINITISRVPINQKITNLRTLTGTTLFDFAEKVFSKPIGDKYDNQSGFSPNLQIYYATAIIANLANNTWLDDKLNRISNIGECITAVKQFLDTNINDNTIKGYQFETHVRQHILPKHLVSNKQQAICFNGGGRTQEFLKHLMKQTVANSIRIIHYYWYLRSVKTDIQHLLDNRISESNFIDNAFIRQLIINNELYEGLKSFFIDYCNKISNKDGQAAIKENNQKVVLSLIKKPRINSYLLVKIKNKINDRLPTQMTATEETELKIIYDKKVDGFKIKTVDNEIKTSLQQIMSSIESMSFTKQIENYETYCQFMLAIHNGATTFYFEKTFKDGREYNPATKVARIFRTLLPFGVTQADLKSANAQFIDRLVGSDIYTNVYDNIVKNKGISRSQAKVEYNSALNNRFMSKKDKLELFKECGYTLEQAEMITFFSSNISKPLFFTMVDMEEDAIKQFTTANNLENYARVHDAILLPFISKLNEIDTYQYEITNK